MQTSDFDYALPPEQVAVAPADRRDDARLLVMNRTTGACKHAQFHELLAFLPPAALLVLNDTRVFPARLRGRKPTGGVVEVFLTRQISDAPPDAAPQAEWFSETWEALTRGFPPAATVEPLTLAGGLTAELLERRSAGRAVVRVAGPGPSLHAALERFGEVPLPPYIESARRRLGPDAPRVDDRARYQTVFAAAPGAVAAPTAGLHFTPALLDAVRGAGHEVAFVTLHVGPGTFRPVEVEDPASHHLEAEHYEIGAAAAEAIARARAARRPVVAVGTTVVRTLEAAARRPDGAEGPILPGAGETDLFVRPGARFAVVTDLITNFHLPRSTLLMLVAAFAGREPVLAAYREAIDRGYRFYSYGDAMLIRSEGA